MKRRFFYFAAGALVALPCAANAAPIVGQISLGGFVEAMGSVSLSAATGLDFVGGAAGGASLGTPGGITSFGGGSGTFAGLSCADGAGGCGVIRDIASFAASGPIANFMTLAAGAATISFDLTEFSSIVRDVATGSIALGATGTLHLTGFDATTGTFVLTAQGDNITSFSATAATMPTGGFAGTSTPSSSVDVPPAPTALPEPASLALLGGSVAALGLIRRKQASA